MVLQHIDRDRTPTAETAGANFLYLDPTRLNALAAIAAAVERGAKTALCMGSAGAGKSTLLRGLARDLVKRGVAVANGGRGFECRPSTSVDEIWGLIEATGALRADPGPEEVRHPAWHRTGQRHALLLDDVEHLDPEILDRLWQRWQGVTVPTNALTLVMTAAKRRSNAFQPSVFEAMAAGADVAVDLSPMSRSETETFVTQYLRAIGYPGLEVFTPAAFDQFAFYGRGTPGRLVQLAPAVLALAEQRGAKTITSELVKQAAHEVFLPQRLKDLARAVGHSDQEADDRLDAAAPSLRAPRPWGDDQRVPDFAEGRVRDTKPRARLEPEPAPEPVTKPEAEPEADPGVSAAAAAAAQVTPSRRASYSRILLALTLVAFVLGVGVGVSGSFFRGTRDVETATSAQAPAPPAPEARPERPARGDVAQRPAMDSPQARADRLAQAERTVEIILSRPPATSPSAAPRTAAGAVSSAETSSPPGSAGTDASHVVAVDLDPLSDDDVAPSAGVEADPAGSGDLGTGRVAGGLDADVAGAPRPAAVAPMVTSETVASGSSTGRSGDSVAGPPEGGRGGADAVLGPETQGTPQAPAGSATLVAPSPAAGADETIVGAAGSAAIPASPDAADDRRQADAGSRSASTPEDGVKVEAAPAPGLSAVEAAPNEPAPVVVGSLPIPSVGAEPSVPPDRSDQPAPRVVGDERGGVPLAGTDEPAAASSDAAPAATAPPPAEAPRVASPPVAAAPVEASVAPEAEPEAPAPPVAAATPATATAPEPGPAFEGDAAGAGAPNAGATAPAPETVVAALPPADETAEVPPREVFVFEADVQAAQRLLNRLGYRAGAADGFFGRRTETAIRAFEQSEGLPVSGRVTDRLIAALEQRAGASPGAERRPTATGTSASAVDAGGVGNVPRTAGDDTLAVMRECAGRQSDWVYAESLGRYVFCRRFGQGPVR